MKHFFILTALLISIDSFGQFGFKGGYTHSKVKSTVDATFKGYNGFSYGIFYAIKLTKHFYLQPETNFVRKGWKSRNALLWGSPPAGTILPEITAINDFLEVPLLLKWQFGEKRKPYFMGGIS